MRAQEARKGEGGGRGWRKRKSLDDRPWRSAAAFLAGRISHATDALMDAFSDASRAPVGVGLQPSHSHPNRIQPRPP